MSTAEIFDTFRLEESGIVYETLLTKKVKERKAWKRPDDQEIRSIIPGTVSVLKVKEGDKVGKGEELMEYEAMKMQNVIKAPFDGTVEKIYVKEGEKLAKGEPMIFLRSSANVPDPA
ncbi:MAG: acetyl-CoA carboxylase biotin carboxyl carrier protein subunit [Bacteroidales bacterium]|nr:acetyl-CoA carboxylase biotin carboxyl carrier protein subunit [Bacteroidales bacterium]